MDTAVVVVVVTVCVGGGGAVAAAADDDGDDCDDDVDVDVDDDLEVVVVAAIVVVVVVTGEIAGAIRGFPFRNWLISASWSSIICSSSALVLFFSTFFGCRTTAPNSRALRSVSSDCCWCSASCASVNIMATWARRCITGLISRPMPDVGGSGGGFPTWRMIFRTSISPILIAAPSPIRS